MTIYCAFANAALTGAATWEALDATSYLDAQSNNTALTTAYVESQTFTPGAITIDGIAVKIASRAASPTGTMSLRLAAATVTVPGTEIAVNVSDVPTCSAGTSTTVPAGIGEGGWFFVKFAAPVLLVALTVYTISGKTSSAAQVNLYHNVTGANWARFLRTTTAGTLGAGDDAVITGEWTAAATVTARTVTMDSTAATDYGSASTSCIVASLAICNNGTLTYGTTAATNYILRQSGIVQVYNGGTLNIGTTGTPIPRGGTAVLEFDCAADQNFGLIIHNGATVNGQGLSRTVGKNISWTRLAANVAASATSATTVDDTGWLNGDTICFASTTRTASQFESKALGADASGTSLPTIAAITNAHSGTSPTQGEVGLLNRSVEIRAVTSTLTSFAYCGLTSSIDFDWVSFRYLGSNGSKIQLTIATTTGSATFDYCSFRDFEDGGLNFAAANENNFYFRHCVFYNIAGSHSSISAGGTSGSSWELSDNLFCGATGGVTGVVQNDFSGVFKNNVITSTVGTGLSSTGTTGQILAANASGNIIHSNDTFGYDLVNSGVAPVFSGWQSWRNGDIGLRASSLGGTGATFLSFILFGNTTTNFQFQSATGIGSVIFDTCTLAADSTFATTNNLNFNGVISLANLQFLNCLLSQATGIYVAATNDINVASLTGTYQMYADNTVFGGTNVLANFTAANKISFLRSQRQDQTDGKHRTYTPITTIALDAATFHTAAPSEKVSPNSASVKSQSGIQTVNCLDGATANVSVWVYKDGSYAGAQPRLILLRQDSMGVASDTVGDTMTGGATTWEELTYTTPTALEDGAFSFVVDCDGTAGAIYVDDWSAP